MAERRYTIRVCADCGSDDLVNNAGQVSFCNECQDWTNRESVEVVAAPPEGDWTPEQEREATDALKADLKDARVVIEALRRNE